MPIKRLDKDFYTLRATDAAPMLLGKFFCRRTADGRVLRRRITETECYFGESDTACHASRGKTKRTETLYRGGGCAYIYLCYGIHSLFNIVTGAEGFPEAVLIRGIEGFNGPGKLTRALEIDVSLNGEDLTSSNQIWFEEDGFVPPFTALPRIGIDYADKEDRERLWRFVARTN